MNKMVFHVIELRNLRGRGYRYQMVDHFRADPDFVFHNMQPNELIPFIQENLDKTHWCVLLHLYGYRVNNEPCSKLMDNLNK